MSYDPTVLLEGNALGRIASSIAANREILIIRVKDVIANGAGINLYGDLDSLWPGQTIFYNGGTAFNRILINGVFVTESGRQKKVTRITSAASPYTALASDEIIFASASSASCHRPGYHPHWCKNRSSLQESVSSSLSHDEVGSLRLAGLSGGLRQSPGFSFRGNRKESAESCSSPVTALYVPVHRNPSRL